MVESHSRSESESRVDPDERLSVVMAGFGIKNRSGLCKDGKSWLAEFKKIDPDVSYRQFRANNCGVVFSLVSKYVC
jgi:hypothetical protein